MGNKVQEPGLHHSVIAVTVAELDRVRQERGLSDYEWAHLSGLPQSTVPRLVREGRNLTVYTMCKLASGLGLRPKVIFYELDPKDAYPPQPKRVQKGRVRKPVADAGPKKPRAKKVKIAEFATPKVETPKTVTEVVKVASEHESGYTIKRKETVVANFGAEDTSAAVEAFLSKMGA